MAGHARLAAITIGKQPPVAAVQHEEGLEPPDSGYVVWLSDVDLDLDLDGLADDDERLGMVCLHCVIDSYPEAGRGLDLARRHGYVERNPETGTWEWEWAE